MIKRKILITGGAGNIGGSLAQKLVTDPENLVYIVDNLSTGSLSKLPSREYLNWKFIKCDINNYIDISGIMLSQQFDYVFHYAAVVGVQRTLANPVAVLNDIEGIRNVLTLCKNTFVKRIYFSSSSEVYGEPVEFPQNEYTTPLNSKLPYAVVKNVGESYVRSYYQEFGLNYTIFRFFNTYGPNQSKDFVIPSFIHSALTNKPIHIYGDGSQTRTFCYIDDNTETTAATIYDDLGINETINVGNDNEISILDLAHKIIQMTDSSSAIIHLPPLKEGDMTRRKPHIAKMKDILSRDLIPLEIGLNTMITHIENKLNVKRKAKLKSTGQ